MGRRSRCEVGCLTSFREPVPRIMSCYSDRLVGSEHVAPACMADAMLHIGILTLGSINGGWWSCVWVSVSDDERVRVHEGSPRRAVEASVGGARLRQ